MSLLPWLVSITISPSLSLCAHTHPCIILVILFIFVVCLKDMLNAHTFYSFYLLICTCSLFVNALISSCAHAHLCIILVILLFCLFVLSLSLSGTLCLVSVGCVMCVCWLFVVSDKNQSYFLVVSDGNSLDGWLTWLVLIFLSLTGRSIGEVCTIATGSLFTVHNLRLMV